MCSCTLQEGQPASQACAAAEGECSNQPGSITVNLPFPAQACGMKMATGGKCKQCGKLFGQLKRTQQLS